MKSQKIAPKIGFSDLKLIFCGNDAKNISVIWQNDLYKIC